MPKLTGEELSRLYPKAKTYDELRAQHEEIREIRRPKFVTLKIAIWTALIVPVALVVSHGILHFFSTLETSSTTGVLSSVSIMMLLAIVGLATIYYLYSLIDSVASKTLVATFPLYFILFLLLCATGGLAAFLREGAFSPLLLGGAAMLFVFVASLITVSVYSKYQ